MTWAGAALTPLRESRPRTFTASTIPRARSRQCATSWATRPPGTGCCFLDADDELAPGFLDAMRRAVGQAGDGPALLTPAINHPGRFYSEGPIEETNWLVVGTLVQRRPLQRGRRLPGLPARVGGLGAMGALRAGRREDREGPECRLRAPPQPRVGDAPDAGATSAWQVATHERIFAELFPEA